MTNTTDSGSNPDRTRQDVPRWAATARRRTTLTQLLTQAARALRRRSIAAAAHSDSGCAPVGAVPTRIRDHLLRNYHTGLPAKARSGSEELVRAGWHTGAIPSGYRPERVRIRPPGPPQVVGVAAARQRAGVAEHQVAQCRRTREDPGRRTDRSG